MIGLVAALTDVIGLLGYVIRSKLSTISDDTAQVNAAVNHKETGELSLYRLADSNSKKLDEVIAKQAEFDRKWGNLPPEIDNAVGLNEVLHDMNQAITQVQAELRQHVAWEMGQKYPKGDT